MMYVAKGCPLVFTGTPSSVPVLTCQLRRKWYRLYLVLPSGKVREAPLDLDELEQYTEGETAVGDHCWNPNVLQRLADAKGWIIDDVALDLITGRWVNDFLGGLPKETKQ